MVWYSSSSWLVLAGFLAAFDDPSRPSDGRVTPEEFCAYYGQLSCSMDDDGAFVDMVKRAWHVDEYDDSGKDYNSQKKQAGEQPSFV